jgi:hypothetical protein
MRKVIGGIIGLFGAGVIQAVIFFSLPTEPCPLVNALTCRVFDGNSYSDFASFASAFPIAAVWILGVFIGGVAGAASG